MGGPSLWNSSIVSTLQEPLSNNSNNTGSPDGNVTTIDNNSLTAVSAVATVGSGGNSATAITSPIASSKKTSKSSPNSSNNSMVYKKSFCILLGFYFTIYLEFFFS